MPHLCCASGGSCSYAVHILTASGNQCLQVYVLYPAETPPLHLPRLRYPWVSPLSLFLMILLSTILYGYARGVLKFFVFYIMMVLKSVDRLGVGHYAFKEYTRGTRNREG